MPIFNRVPSKKRHNWTQGFHSIIDTSSIRWKSTFHSFFFFNFTSLYSSFRQSPTAMDVTLIERRGFREILSSKSVLANGTSFPRDSDFWSGSDVFPTSSPRCHRKRVHYSVQKDIYQSRYASSCEIHNSRGLELCPKTRASFFLIVGSDLAASSVSRRGKRLGNSRFSQTREWKGLRDLLTVVHKLFPSL